MVSASQSLILLAVTVTIKSRIVTVKGPRGQVTKDFSHIAVEMQILKQKEKKRTGNYIRFRMWFGAYKQACSVRTLVSLIENMFTGVTEVSCRFRHFSEAHFTFLGL
jgi:large subunit ribosomal protein L9e